MGLLISQTMNDKLRTLRRGFLPCSTRGVLSYQNHLGIGMYQCLRSYRLRIANCDPFSPPKKLRVTELNCLKKAYDAFGFRTNPQKRTFSLPLVALLCQGQFCSGFLRHQQRSENHHSCRYNSHRTYGFRSCRQYSIFR